MKTKEKILNKLQKAYWDLTLLECGPEYELKVLELRGEIEELVERLEDL